MKKIFRSNAVLAIFIALVLAACGQTTTVVPDACVNDSAEAVVSGDIIKEYKQTPKCPSTQKALEQAIAVMKNSNQPDATEHLVVEGINYTAIKYPNYGGGGGSVYKVYISN